MRRFLILLAAGVLLGGLAASQGMAAASKPESSPSASAGPPRWAPTVSIGDGWNNQDMVFDSADNAYLVWHHLMFSRSGDNGHTWSPPEEIAPMGPGRRGNPDLAIDSTGTLYAVVEFQAEGATLYQLMLTKSDDGGITWTTPVQITDTSKHTAWPKLEVDSLDRVHVIWQDQCNLHDWGELPLPGCVTNEYYHMISTDQAASWSAPHLIMSTPWGGWTLHSAVDSVGAFYGSWSYEGNVHVFKSADGGLTWSDMIVGEGNENAVAVDGSGTIHVLFANYSGPDTRTFLYRSGVDGGASWSGPIVVAAGSGESGFNPSAWCSIAADDNSRNVLVAWQDGSSGEFEVFVRRSPNGGKTWQKSENVSETPLPSLQPELFFDYDSDAHIVWNDDFVISYRRGPIRGR